MGHRLRVLIDYAHEDLWESLELLFTDRFGWELYRPIGMDWHTEGYWRFESEAVARQFLEPWPDDVGVTDWERDDSGVAHPLVAHSERGSIPHPNRRQKMWTLEQARDMKPDLVIATLAENEPGLHRFAQEVGAHYGIQVGNQGAPNQWGAAEFAMLSVTTPGFTPWMPHVTYHQEFDLDVYRHDWPPSEPNLIANRVQCITGTHLYKRFRRIAEDMPKMRFRWYGHCGEPDEHYGGDTPYVGDIADSMRASLAGWHAKEWSDGYGHVIHAWFAVGRPTFVSGTYYADKFAGALMEHGVTCYDLDRMSDTEVVDTIGRLRVLGDEHRAMSEAAAARFREVVDFDAEAEAIRAMLEGVMS